MGDGRSLQVFLGPARSGKTAAVIELYRRRLDEPGWPGCLILVPSEPARRQMRQRLLAECGTGVLVSPAVMTFAQLGWQVLSTAGVKVRGQNEVQRRLLLVAIVYELRAAGELEVLASLADTPGLPAALDASIAELKRAAIEPERFAQVVSPDSPKDRDLLKVYRRYQERLLANDLCDVEGLTWLARDKLRQQAGEALALTGRKGLRALAVDGFTDFTPTQLDIIGLLSDRLEETLITLPMGEEGRRQRLWFWTNRTLERIRQRMPAAQVNRLATGADPLPLLFDLSLEAPPPAVAGAAPAMGILEAFDDEAMIRAVARRVKRDLFEDPSQAVAIVARDLSGLTECIERLLPEYGIPLAPRPGPVLRSGAVRFVLQLLSLAPDYECHDLLAVIKSSYFQPAALGTFDKRTAAVAEMAIRTANVLGGRQAYAPAFRALVARASRQQGPGDDDGEDGPAGLTLGPLAVGPEQLEQAAGLVESLLARLAPLEEAGDAATYVAAARALVRDLGISEMAMSSRDDAALAADLRALRSFDGLLDELAEAELPAAIALSDAGSPLHQRVTILLRQLAQVAVTSGASGEGLVSVLSAVDARALAFDRVYLVGVGEDSFPQLSAERCFIGEADRTQWSRRGLPLDRRSDLIGREMLLFYLACSRGRRGLTIAYTTSDASGKPRGRSVYVDELEAACRRAGAALTVERVPPGQFVPPVGEIASPEEAFLSAVSSVFAPDAAVPVEQARGLLRRQAQQQDSRLERAARGLLASHRRWRRDAPDAFDGRIDEPSLLAWLARTIPSEFVFSASELNRYAGCPWQFFARHLLHLAELEDVQPQLTPAQRGSFCHAVLWQTMTSLRERHGREVRLPGVAQPVRALDLGDVPADEVRAVLAGAVEAERRRLAAQTMYGRLWEAQTALWQRCLERYLSAQQAGDDALPAAARPALFELAFGLDRGGEQCDSLSQRSPVEIEAGGLRLRLRGKIDRVDLVGPDLSLLAIDYKTGSMPGGAEIVSAIDLQLVLYVQALGRLFPEASCCGGAYHDVRRNGRSWLAAFRVPRNELGLDFPRIVQRSMERLAEYIQGMRAGRFDALPKGTCASFCPYRRICQYSPARAERKCEHAAPVDAPDTAGADGRGQV